MFWSKNKKKSIHCKPQFYYIKVGCKWVFVTRTCVRDAYLFTLFSPSTFFVIDSSSSKKMSAGLSKILLLIILLIITIWRCGLMKFRGDVYRMGGVCCVVTPS